MRESELFEGNRFVRGIKKIHDRFLAIVRPYDQLRPAHVTLAVAWRQTLLLSLDLSRLRKASLIPLSRFWGLAAIEWPTFTPKTVQSDRRAPESDRASAPRFGSVRAPTLRVAARCGCLFDMGSGTNAT
jgi:hypothetical protein